MDATQYKQAILQTLDAIGGEVTACADAIHGYAELSGEEHRSAAALEELLEHHGFAVERGLKDLPTAFRAVYGSGPVRIGFMCEYDALAGLQQDDVPCQQGNGTPGHGCGHNLLGAGSAAAGIALARLVDQGLPATVVVYGTRRGDPGRQDHYGEQRLFPGCGCGAGLAPPQPQRTGRDQAQGGRRLYHGLPRAGGPRLQLPRKRT